MSQKFVTCNDGTRIYLELDSFAASATCEKHGQVCFGATHSVARKMVDDHAYDRHGGTR